TSPSYAHHRHLPSFPTRRSSDLAQASKRVPHGVVCLLSALRFHDLTTQSPFQVWLAISAKARLPKTDNPPLRIVRFSQRMLAYRSEEHTSELQSRGHLVCRLLLE